MKGKVLLIAIILIANSFNLIAQTELLKNTEHVIYYSFSGENIVFTIEDLKDDENNLADQPTGRSINCGKYPESAGMYDADGTGYFNFDHDVSIIEFDYNLNGQLEQKIDLGYYMNDRSTGANGHYLASFYQGFSNLSTRSSSSGSSNGISWNTKSKALATQKWSTSTYATKSHPIYTYTFPITEIMNTDSMKIKARFIVYRRAKNWTSGITYGTFMYPAGNNCDYTNPVFYTIDLNSSTEAAIVKIKTAKIAADKAKADAKAEALIMKNLVSTEAHKKATTTLPAYDGLFVKLSNGKYVEIPNYTFTYGWVDDYTVSDGYKISKKLGSSKKPFYTEEEFFLFGIVKIKKSEFSNYTIVAGDALKTIYSYQSLHPVNIIKLEQGKFRLFTASESSSKFFGKMLENQTIYMNGDEQTVIENTGTSNSHIYTLSGTLEPGLYGVWAGSYNWIFEITD